MTSRTSKDALFDALAQTAKSLGSGRRLEILDLLAQGERSVEEIAGEIDQPVANASHHLRLLARSGLIRHRREGTRIIYSLASDDVAGLWSLLREVAAANVAEIRRLAETYLGDRDGLEPVRREELARRLKRGEVVVVDVRPEREFDVGHIPGAVCIPVAELRRRLRALPKDKEIVAYCRGPLCVYADEAVRLLRAKGYRASRLEDGLPEWRRAGLPIAAGHQT